MPERADLFNEGNIPGYVRYLLPWIPHTSLRGGRSSSKTSTIARMFVNETYSLGEPRLMMCCRMVQKSIEDSAKAALEDAIDALGLEDYFDVQAHKIICLRNGAEIHFEGLQNAERSIKGWNRVHWCWIEEAEDLTERIYNLVIPTVLRQDLARMFYSWNPDQRSDFMWQRFVDEVDNETDVSLLINWEHNPFLPEQSRQQALRMQQTNPIAYRHYWLGEPRDGGGDEIVLPFDVLSTCVELYEEGMAGDYRNHSPLTDGGLDIADAGDNLNSITVRIGPVIEYVETWPTLQAGFLSPTALRAHDVCMDLGVWRLAYDATGVGSPLREAFARLENPYMLVPIGFGDQVGGPKRMYERRHTNLQTFSRRNAQMAFALKNRAMRTMQLANGIDVDPSLCLFIRPDCVQGLLTLTRFMSEMSRPLWRKNTYTGKIEIDKTGEENKKSPDTFDSTSLAFSRDSDSGLRAF